MQEWRTGASQGCSRFRSRSSETHSSQLPNTFAFAHGAAGKPVGEADYLAFAEDLIPGLGETIVRAWQALAGSDPAAMRAGAAELAQLPPRLVKGLEAAWKKMAAEQKHAKGVRR